MSLWNIANEKKSILFDVLHVIDKASRDKIRNESETSYTLLNRDTVQLFDKLYKTAGDADEMISAALYIQCDEKNINRFTTIYSYFFDKAVDMPSFEHFVGWLETSDSVETASYIVKRCLTSTKNKIPMEFIPYMIKTESMDLISMLNETSLSNNVKYSIYTLIFNYSEFMNCFMEYINKVHEAVLCIYKVGISVYRSTARALREYLRDNNGMDLTKEGTKLEMKKSPDKKKCIIVLSLANLEYGKVINGIDSFIYIKGLIRVQREIHSEGFRIF